MNIAVPGQLRGPDKDRHQILLRVVKAKQDKVVSAKVELAGVVELWGGEALD